MKGINEKLTTDTILNGVRPSGRSDITQSYGIFIFSFLKTPYSIETAPIYVTTNSEGVFISSSPSSKLVFNIFGHIICLISQFSHFLFCPNPPPQ